MHRVLLFAASGPEPERLSRNSTIDGKYPIYNSYHLPLLVLIYPLRHWKPVWSSRTHRRRLGHLCPNSPPVHPSHNHRIFTSIFLQTTKHQKTEAAAHPSQTHLVRSHFQPWRSASLIGQSRAAQTLSISIHTTHLARISMYIPVYIIKSKKCKKEVFQHVQGTEKRFAVTARCLAQSCR